MHRNLNSLIGHTVLATDGEVGRVGDLCFDDKTWCTAYLVVSMGTGSRDVLLPPTALGKPDWERREFPVVYSKEQVRNSPELDPGGLIPPKEIDSGGSTGWKRFWMPSVEVGLGVILMADEASNGGVVSGDQSLREDDPHLWSAKEVIRYRIHASDGKVGHVQDLIVDDTTWAIHSLVVNVKNWFPGKEVLISPQYINKIDRTEGEISVCITTKMVRESPEYNPPVPVEAEYEMRLQDYYENRFRPPDSVVSMRSARKSV